jgi:hypothetical protein
MAEDMEVDDRGIPITSKEETHAPHCPPKPCDLCTGNSQLRHLEEDRFLTSWEWCQYMDTCAATVDWERLFNKS